MYHSDVAKTGQQHCSLGRDLCVGAMQQYMETLWNNVLFIAFCIFITFVFNDITLFGIPKIIPVVSFQLMCRKVIVIEVKKEVY